MSDVKFTLFRGKAIFIDGSDVDTDRIIPARYLRAVTFDGLGEHAFADARRALADEGRLHPFDDPKRARAEVLVVGRNFGCGSSREHAPQALKRWGLGLKVIVGESFSEIFFGNSVALGLPCVTADPAHLAKLRAAVKADPELDVAVDLGALEARFGQQSIPLSMPEGARLALTSGRWDSTSELLANKESVQALAQALPYFPGWM